MKTISLGNADIQVSVFCLGTAHFGWGIDEATSQRLLDVYADKGGFFLDTANAYGEKDGQRVGQIVEQCLGKWMKERRNRDRMFVATKVGLDYVGGAEHGLRAGQIEAECEKSLRRLGKDSIDLYYAHIDDRETPLEETLEAFYRLVRAGKVRFIGASNHLAWRLEEARWISQANGWAEYCCIQQRHSYLRPKPGAGFGPQINVNDDLMDYCRARNIQLLAYSPLLGGSYTRMDRPIEEQYVGPDTDVRFGIIHTVAAELGTTVNQVVLAWMAQNAPPVIPLVAADTVEQMQENLGALEVELSDEQMARLNNATG